MKYKCFIFRVKKPSGYSSQFSLATKRSLKEIVKRLGFDYTTESRDKYNNRIYTGLGTRDGFTLTLLTFEEC